MTEAPRSYPDKASDALDRIWDIVHTPSKATNHRSAERHFMADFDVIRQIIKDFRTLAPAQGSGDCGKLWTPDQFWQFVEGLTDPFVRDQIRDTMIERGLSLTSPARGDAT